MNYARIVFTIFAQYAIGSLLQAGESVTVPTPKASEITFLADDFLDNLQGEFILDPLRAERVGKYIVPNLFNGDWMLTSHPAPLVETFSARTRADASIYVRLGDEFVLISSSVKESGAAAGIVLDPTSPAYQSLIKGKRYTGKAFVFSKNYMADFDLLRDAEGNVLGAYFLGIPVP